MQEASMQVAYIDRRKAPTPSLACNSRYTLNISYRKGIPKKIKGIAPQLWRVSSRARTLNTKFTFHVHLTDKVSCDHPDFSKNINKTYSGGHTVEFTCPHCPPRIQVTAFLRAVAVDILTFLCHSTYRRA